MMPQQISMFEQMDNFNYDMQLQQLKKLMRKSLLKGDIMYQVTKKALKEWLLQLNKDELFSEISSEDLYYVAEEMCNMKVRI